MNMNIKELNEKEMIMIAGGKSWQEFAGGAIGTIAGTATGAAMMVYHTTSWITVHGVIRTNIPHAVIVAKFAATSTVFTFGGYLFVGMVAGYFIGSAIGAYYASQESSQA